MQRKTVLQKLLGDTLLLPETKKKSLLDFLDIMTVSEIEECISMIQNAEKEVQQTYLEAKNIQDPKFWYDFNNFTNKRTKQMYRENEEKIEENIEEILN